MRKCLNVKCQIYVPVVEGELGFCKLHSQSFLKVLGKAYVNINRLKSTR